MEKKNNITFRQLYHDLVDHILKGRGASSEAERRAAFDNSGLTGPLKTLVDKTANYAYKISDNDVNAARESGLSEDQIFELVVCAAAGQASRQYLNALDALSEVAKEQGGQYAS